MEDICSQLTSVQLSHDSHVEHINFTMSYDYVAIQTNHTSHIININPHFDNDINKNVLHYNRLDQLLYLEDNGYKYYGDVNECHYVNSIIKTSGVIVLKDLFFSDVMKIINYLEVINFCSFCSVEYIKSMQLFKKDGRNILLVCIDTEFE